LDTFRNPVDTFRDPASVSADDIKALLCLTPLSEETERTGQSPVRTSSSWIPRETHELKEAVGDRDNRETADPSSIAVDGYRFELCHTSPAAHHVHGSSGRDPVEIRTGAGPQLSETEAKRVGA
jgi:hypothetical protein